MNCAAPSLPASLWWLQETFPARASELAQQLQLTPVQLLAFHTTIAQMYIPYDPQTLPIEQFEGFFALQDLNLSDYEPRTRSIQSVLGMAKTNQSQVIKQPSTGRQMKLSEVYLAANR
jgi:trehalose/maltose hydrolase-like predicted phosphorylase